MKTRVGRHVASIQAVFDAYSSKAPEKPLVVDNMPSYSDLVGKGLGPYLQAP